METFEQVDYNEGMESEVIEFMKNHRHLTVRECIRLYVK